MVSHIKYLPNGRGVPALLGAISRFVYMQCLYVCMCVCVCVCMCISVSCIVVPFRMFASTFQVPAAGTLAGARARVRVCVCVLCVCCVCVCVRVHMCVCV